MRSIKIKDLEIIEQEKETNQSAEQSTVHALAQLTVENAKKDLLIQNLSKSVADLTLEIAKIKGGTANV